MIKNRRPAIKKILLIGIPSLFIAGMVYLMLFPIFKMALHLDFSQEYRKVKGENRVMFRESWHGRVYTRTFWGLRIAGIGKNLQSSPQGSVAKLSWLDTEVYDVSADGESAVWYDRQEDKIFLGNLAGEAADSFDTQYTVSQILLSPDGKYILYCEIAYSVYGGYSTDEEYCYYQVIDIENREQYEIYSGYREWFQVYWE